MRTKSVCEQAVSIRESKNDRGDPVLPNCVATQVQNLQSI